MSLPQPLEYHAAIQNPSLCFADPDLRQGRPTLGPLGMPKVASGNFASVYQVSTRGGPWAVRCFHRSAGNLQARYATIAAHQRRYHPGCLVPCDYMPQGILVRGTWYPIIKMAWVEAPPLNQHVQQSLAAVAQIDALAAAWRSLGDVLEAQGVAHGDLQHGNILVPSPTTLKLVDYDGMVVPSFPPGPAAELGHPAYQHPRRTASTPPRDADRFSSLLIYVALRSIALRPDLWARFDNGDNLLFRAVDLQEPRNSPLFLQLLGLHDRTLVELVERLAAACQETAPVASLTEELAAAEGRPASTSSRASVAGGGQPWWHDRVAAAPSARIPTQPEPAAASAQPIPAVATVTAPNSWWTRLLHAVRARPAPPPPAPADVQISAANGVMRVGEPFDLTVTTRRSGAGLHGIPITVKLFAPHGKATRLLHQMQALTSPTGNAQFYLVPPRAGPVMVDVLVTIDGKERRFNREFTVQPSLIGTVPAWLRPSPPVTSARVTAPFVASQTGDRFHRSTCLWAYRIKGKPRQFATVQQALWEGYQPCKICKPS